MDITYLPAQHKILVTTKHGYELKTLKNHLTRFVPNYRWNPRYKMKLWDGKDTLYNPNGLLPYGLWKEVFLLCQEMNYPFHITNKSEFPINRDVKIPEVEEWCYDFYKNHKSKKDINEPFIPREYQIQAVSNIMKNRYGNLEIATSGGKTLVCATFIFHCLSKINPDAKILIIVPSILLVTQFYDDINSFNIGFHNENESKMPLNIVEMMSDKPRSYADNPNVFISTYQTLSNYPKEYFKQFYAVITDEAHTTKTITLNTILNATIPYAYYRFGMSGSYPDNTSLDILKIQALTGPIITKIKAHTLQDMNFISQLLIKVLIINHNDFEFHTNVINAKKVDGKMAYLLEVEKVQNSAKRLDLHIKLLKSTNKNTLILFTNKEHGKTIYNHILSANLENKRIFYIDGDVSKNKRLQIIEEMKSEDSQAILVASYGTLSTGISIDSINYIFLADSVKSKFRLIQSIGRALRLHETKKKAIVIDMVDIFDSDLTKKRNILYDHHLERISIYNKEKYNYQITEINL